MKMFFKNFFLAFALFVFESLGLCQVTNHWETVFKSDSEFAFHLSSQGNPGPDWRIPDYNDSSWEIGQGGIGFGDDDDNTIVDACISICLRKKFTIFDCSIISDAVLHMDYDDAFVAYLNGVEIARSGGLTEAFPAFDEYASISHEANMYQGGKPEGFRIPKKVLKELIVNGENVLAFQVHNRDVNSPDISTIAFLSLGITTVEKQYSDTPWWFVPPFAFNTSSLPIIIIDTKGQIIPDEPKIDGILQIIHYPDSSFNSIDWPANEYDGYLGIEVRGATSASYPQRPYSLETRKENGENDNVELLGMPKENDWLLISHYNEKTFMRNPISFHLFREMGHYAPRNHLCEVVLNGYYQGIYLFTEKIKRDKNRVDVAKIYKHNNSGDVLSGGYIFKSEDYSYKNTWKSNYSPYYHPNYNTRFAYYYPKIDDISSEQKTYIKSAVDQFQSILQQNDFADKYKDYIDVNSFIDYFIISELSRNVDAYKKSRYLYKKRDSEGGLIYSGPVWDMDWAWKNIWDCPMFSVIDGSGWAYKINDCCNNPSPGWMTRLLDDPVFADRLKCRYTELRHNILSDDAISAFIDSMYLDVVDAQMQHFKRWNTLGHSTGAPEIEGPAATFDEEVSRLRDWIDIRLAWLDTYMPGSADNCDQLFVDQNNNFVFRLFPNPASSELFVESDQRIESIKIYSINGQQVYSCTVNEFSYYFDVSWLNPGLYLLQSRFISGDVQSSRLIIK